MGAEPTLISSVQRALHLLEAAAGHERGASAKVLARETGLPLGTTYHLLRTLVHEGYLYKRHNGNFVLGASLATLSDDGQAQSELRRSRPALTALRDELGMATYLVKYEEGEIRGVDVADGPKAPRVQQDAMIGEAAAASAAGKCILRQLDEESRKDYLVRHPPQRVTPHTVTRCPQLQQSLAGTSPLVWDEQEFELGTGCAAVPITHSTGVGALAVSYQMHRWREVEAATARLQSAARFVSYALTLHA